jgi:hypothetical protein
MKPAIILTDMKSHEERIAQMQRIINRQMDDIEREQNRPSWHLVAFGVAALLSGMGFMAGCLVVAKHLF